MHVHVHGTCCDTCRRDPEGIFAEPVTDSIAPGYSSIIKHPMDLTTMSSKLENNMYTSLTEFKVSLTCVYMHVYA